MSEAYRRHTQGMVQALNPHAAKRPRTSFDIPSGARPGFSSLFENNGAMFHQTSPRFGEHLHIAGPRQIPLHPHASPTVFVEGLPATTSRREVSHIFRPFLGYKAVRLVTKESRHSGGERLLLCFVDFESPAHAATAIHALQDISSKGKSGWPRNGLGIKSSMKSFSNIGNESEAFSELVTRNLASFFDALKCPSQSSLTMQTAGLDSAVYLRIYLLGLMGLRSF